MLLLLTQQLPHKSLTCPTASHSSGSEEGENKLINSFFPSRKPSIEKECGHL